ncbi:protein translocase subunit SecD [Pseudomarimonas arenosa]|uniref:Protein translocase subunit SecD n=1 Tax=Pseudomarimonas arenosa TaxID=2774145 RepID=A0AAW3ZTD1_9GAMM|nr:protein translocase subunit SecD [Pseudomarimonas arenosa]MBD8527396.1 protein translocase subunit SecD [Pseudomarimonas arenosa]
MLEFARWKYILVMLVCVISVIYAVPNIFPQDPAVQVNGNRGTVVDQAVLERVRGALEAREIGIKNAAVENGSLLVRLNSSDDQLLAADLVGAELGQNYTVALNLASTVPDYLERIKATPMVLGLDLQGGVHFLMEVDEKAALDKRANVLVEDIRSILRTAEIRSTEISQTESGVFIALRDAAEAGKAAQAITAELPELIVEDGSTEGTLNANIRPVELKSILDNALEQNISTLRDRINSLGVSEPVIQRQGSSRIVVQLPGVQDTAMAKRILGATATLEWRAVMGDSPDSAFEAERSGRIPPDARLYKRRERGADGNQFPVLLSKRVIASGDQLVNATSGFDPQSGGPMVSIRLDSTGGQRMLEHTTDNVGKQMGVVFIERIPENKMVDGKEVRSIRINEEVISVATTQGVFGKQFQITGLESSQYANELAMLMRAGSLAAPVDIVEERVIGPSLGQANIEAGARAIVLGFALVCLLMIVYYKLMGVVAVFALFMNLLMLCAVLSFLDATLTMPGIAGIVLTLGMAIDGNVLILERVREELAAGNTPAASIKAGYERAWTVILDSNVTKLIAALALAVFGSGPIRGFAIVLLCGVATSMFSSVTISRAVVTTIYGGRRKVTHVSV